MNKPFQPGFSRGDEARGFSADEFLHMLSRGAFEHMKVELVDGRIVRMNPSHSAHGRALAKIMFRLLEAYGDDRILPDTVLRLGEATVRAFDVAVLHEGVDPEPVLVPADILMGVEVADSSLANDLGEKQSDYARAGIPHYWVIDVEAQVVHIMRSPGADRYENRIVRGFEALLELPEGAGQISLG
jgi:Uma2 family endonuclease